MKSQDEPNPAMGWRAIRVGLDKPGRAADAASGADPRRQGPPADGHVPLRRPVRRIHRRPRHLLRELDREGRLGHASCRRSIEIGAMLETPSLAFAPRRFFEMADFISIGGNDLKQFFFAADRENERVRRRYDTLNVSFLTLHRADRRPLRRDRHHRCRSAARMPAGRSRRCASRRWASASLSMRPASIGPVKHLLRRVDLREVRAVIDRGRGAGRPVGASRGDGLARRGRRARVGRGVARPAPTDPQRHPAPGNRCPRREGPRPVMGRALRRGQGERCAQSA